ncbi:M48 family metallopeptidase [Fulvivirga maritima]|uniref:M48 family metallopeptidase n=1 Tax=Fulvivirga maritima TaxID=2904247 RepID=UPI001F446426|nr:M48 family metallopeptidase [Fulvivirga maritima]UII26925.1 M48 family metallopeptidase [Fulvivirga maritima]
MNANIEKDYRKWILFNNQIEDFQNLYELFTAVESRQGKGGVSIEIEDSPGDFLMTVEQAGYDHTLGIIGEVERKGFLDYLVQHYFPNEEIEEWYQSKVQEKEKSHNIHVSSSAVRAENLDFKVHPKERRYYQWRVFFSSCVYLAILAMLVITFLQSAISGVMAVVGLIAFILLFGLLKRIGQGFFIGLIQGNSVRLNEKQYPEIYFIVKDQCQRIGIKEMPDIYVLHGHFNAFVTKLARNKHLVLFSEVLETASKGDFEVLKFVIGHELGHIKRQHLNHEFFLAPSAIIPFLKLAHSRACEYTCDRIGFHFSAIGSVEGILILATGKEIYSKINTSQFIEDSKDNNNFWVWLSEKFLSHPHIYKRMGAIKNYADRGY